MLISQLQFNTIPVSPVFFLQSNEILSLHFLHSDVKPASAAQLKAEQGKIKTYCT